MEKIIVAVDGSESARAALDWALDHAAPDDTIVIAHAWKLPAVSGLEIPVSSLADFEVAAHQLVKEIVAEIDVGDDGPTIQTDVRSGHPGPMLIDCSEDADLLVVGSRGYGGFRGLLLGSVSTYVVHHAHCPVAVIPCPDADADED